GHGPAGLRHHRHPLRARPAVRGVEVAQALHLVVPQRGPFLRAGDEPDPRRPRARARAAAAPGGGPLQRPGRHHHTRGGPLSPRAHPTLRRERPHGAAGALRTLTRGGNSLYANGVSPTFRVTAGRGRPMLDPPGRAFQRRASIDVRRTAAGSAVAAASSTRSWV